MLNLQIPFEELEQNFNIRHIKRQVDPVALNEPPHRHNFQELLWIKSGSGEHKIDGTLMPIIPQTFYLVAQGQVHYFVRGTNLDGLVIRFTDDFLLDTSVSRDWNYRTTLFSHFAIHRSLRVASNHLARYETIMQMMQHEHAGYGFGKLTSLRHLLSLLLVQLERARRETADKQPPLKGDAIAYQTFTTQLEANYTEQHKVSFYASQLFITPRQLSDMTRRFTGKTAKRLIQERLILEAKRYLQHTNASVKEVSHGLGFDDPSYFSKIFKEHVGVPPHAYKSDL